MGINSSGKSTFLRTFPLLRQSVERKTRGPILWSGHYIDFGTFETSIYSNKNDTTPDFLDLFEESSGDNKNKIEFTFSINYESQFIKRITPLTFTISITKQKNSQNSYTHQFSCEVNKTKYSLTLMKAEQ